MTHPNGKFDTVKSLLMPPQLAAGPAGTLTLTVDYIGTYFTPGGFDFSRLINDDFFQPVRLLFQAGHFVSASKLLMVAIDSIGYVEFGTRTPPSSNG